jgi:hypothetical protein
LIPLPVLIVASFNINQISLKKHSLIKTIKFGFPLFLSFQSYVPRKHRIRMDCSKSTTGQFSLWNAKFPGFIHFPQSIPPQKGLFFGLAFLAGTFTSMAVFSGYTIMGQNHMAATLFGFTDIIHVRSAGLWAKRFM